jgi:HEAT repeat protein
LKWIGAAVAMTSITQTLHGQARRPQTSELIALLQRSDASLYEKARACQQLGEFGTSEAVPALAALLPDQQLSAYARSGLEGIGDPTAAAVLRSSLTKLEGNARIGVVNSLGVLRDRQAVHLLSKMAANPGSGAARESLLALGRIATPEAIKVLQSTLAQGPDSLRPPAAAGILLAAEFEFSKGNVQAASALYDAVRAAAVPATYQVAATRGAILARGSSGIELLIKLLKTDERETRNIALHTIREMPRGSVSPALRKELETAKAEVQAQLIEAVAEAPDPESAQAIRNRLSSPNPDVRRAALRVLWKVGNQSDAPTLLTALQNSQDLAESVAASESLARLQGADVDALILKVLASAGTAASRVALIDVIDARPPNLPATPELLRQAREGELSVSLAALRALRSLVGIAELPALISLTKTYKDGSQRAAAESTLYFASIRTAVRSPAGDLLLAELEQSAEDLDKASWIKTLCAIGYTKALPVIWTSVGDHNAWLAGTTVDQLANWPGPEPIGRLLELAESGGAEPRLRTRVLRAALQLIAAAWDRQQAISAELSMWFQRAGKAAHSADEKRLIISALGRWRNAEALLPLISFLSDPEVKPAAVAAVVDVAQALTARSESYSSIRPALDRLPRTAEPVVNEKLEALRKAVNAAEGDSR